MSRRAAIYCRVSTPGQEDGSSLDTQERACRAWAEERGIADAVVQREVWSGADRHRPGLDAAIATLREGDVFLAYALDRVSRNQLDTAIILDRIEAAGATLELVTEDFERSATGTFLRAAKAFAAELEHEKIAERTTRGRLAKMHGNPGAGVDPRPLGTQRVPFGLRWVEEFEPRGGTMRPMKRRFEADPETIESLRSIFDWYDRGASLSGVGKRLQALGVKPPGFRRIGGTQWSRATVRAILTNENYVGVGYVGTTKHTKADGKTIRPRDEWIMLPHGTYPRVVDDAVFARVRERLEHNKTETVPGNRNPKIGMLRRGVGVCAYCRKGLSVAMNSGKPYYRCHPENRAHHGCGCYGMHVALLDGEVWTFVRNLLQRPGALEAKLFGEPAPDLADAALPAAREEVTRLATERDRVHRRLRTTDDEILAISYESELKCVLAEIRAAEARCQALVAEHEVWRIAQEQRDQVLDDAARIARDVDTLDFAGRRNVLRRLGAEIQLFSEKDADPRWRITTRFTVGRSVSFAVNTPVDLGIYAVGGSSGVIPSGTVLVDDGFDEGFNEDDDAGDPPDLDSRLAAAGASRSAHRAVCARTRPARARTARGARSSPACGRRGRSPGTPAPRAGRGCPCARTLRQ